MTPGSSSSRRIAVLLAAAGLVLVQCATPTSAPPAAPARSQPPAVSAVSAVTAERLGASWRPGCPVGPERLRRVEVDYHGFDGQTHRGELIVHEDRVDEVRAIFADLFAMRYPIEKMQTPEHYPGAVDELSMRDNNTSAFNCRAIPGSSSWSQHAYGRAIDVNPLLNPSSNSSGLLEPATTGRYLDRTRTDPGLLHDGDPAVRAFTDRGWTWGGRWPNPKDYQHFELPG